MKAWSGLRRQLERMAEDRSQHTRGVELLRELRTAVFRYYEENGFNQLLRGLRQQLDASCASMDTEDRPLPSVAAQEFWQQVREAGITLVHEKESRRVEVTQDEANAFVEPPSAPVIASAPAATPHVSARTADEWDEMD